jgi:hypothetical protein
MKNQVISDYIMARTGVNGSTGSAIKNAPTTSAGSGGFISYQYSTTTRLSADGAYLTSGKQITYSDNSKCTYSQAFCTGQLSVGSYDGATTVKSVTELLKETFEAMKKFLIECITKLQALLT